MAAVKEHDLLAGSTEHTTMGEFIHRARRNRKSLSLFMQESETLNTIEALKSDFHLVLSDNTIQTVRLDLSQTHIIDSCFLQTVKAAALRIASAGKNFDVVGPSQIVMRLAETCGLPLI